jgi:ribosomal protein S18 acetylase RimI-like enzyme
MLMPSAEVLGQQVEEELRRKQEGKRPPELGPGNTAFSRPSRPSNGLNFFALNNYDEYDDSRPLTGKRYVAWDSSSTKFSPAGRAVGSLEISRPVESVTYAATAYDPEWDGDLAEYRRNNARDAQRIDNLNRNRQEGELRPPQLFSPDGNYLDRLAVAPEYRGQGIAKQLVDVAVAHHMARYGGNIPQFSENLSVDSAPAVSHLLGRKFRQTWGTGVSSRTLPDGTRPEDDFTRQVLWEGRSIGPRPERLINARCRDAVSCTFSPVCERNGTVCEPGLDGPGG